MSESMPQGEPHSPTDPAAASPGELATDQASDASTASPDLVHIQPEMMAAVIQQAQAPAQPRPVSAADRWAHRRAEPRPFAAIWLAFILGASVLSIGAVGGLGLMSTEVYRPAARVMIALIGAGVALVWPMIRLSQEIPSRPLRSALADAVVVIIPIILVVLPQSLPWMADWPLEVSLSMVAVLAGWSVLVAGVLGWTFSTISLAPRLSILRSWAMAALAVIAIGPGALAGILLASGPVESRIAGGESGVADLLLVASPLTAPFELARERLWTGAAALIGTRHWLAVAAIWLAAAITLLGGLLANRSWPRR